MHADRVAHLLAIALMLLALSSCDREAHTDRTSLLSGIDARNWDQIVWDRDNWQ